MALLFESQQGILSLLDLKQFGMLSKVVMRNSYMTQMRITRQYYMFHILDFFLVSCFLC